MYPRPLCALLRKNGAVQPLGELVALASTEGSAFEIVV